jgi:uncharacterized protein (TIGR02246 family)
MKPLTTAVAISMILLLVTTVKAQHTADSLAIQAILEEEVTSWNKGDAPAYSKHFAERGTFTNIRGMFFTGHKQFLDRHADIFKGMFAKTVLQQEVVSFRFLRPDVAVAETLTWISGFPKDGYPKGVHIDSKGRLHTRLLQVFQKESGDWKIVVYHNVDLKQDAPVPGHK